MLNVFYLCVYSRMGEKGSADLLEKLQRENTDVSSQNVSAYCIINFDLCESSLKKRCFYHCVTPDAFSEMG